MFRHWEFKLGAFIAIYFIISHYVLESTHVHKDKGLSNHLRVIPQQVIDLAASVQPPPPNCAYIQYATSEEYLRLALLNFKALIDADTSISNLVVLYAHHLESSPAFDSAKNYASSIGVELRPVTTTTCGDSLWAHLFTKFEVFNTEFDRVVYFDSDSMLLDTHIDELFSIDSFDIVLPQAYWLNNVVENRKTQNRYNKPVKVPRQADYDASMRTFVDKENRHRDPKSPVFESLFNKLPSLVYEHHKWDNRMDFFANHVMVITPLVEVYEELMRYVHSPWWWHIVKRSSLRKFGEYDMEVMNKWIDDRLRAQNIRVGILPHKTYGVLTGEFREPYHRRFTVEPQYLPFVGKYESMEWDAKSAVRAAKLVHFSDAPLPKPWEEEDYEMEYNAFRIACARDAGAGDWAKYGQWKPRLVEDCDAAEIWEWIRAKFREKWEE